MTSIGFQPRFSGRIWKEGLTPAQANQHPGAIRVRNKQDDTLVNVVILHDSDGVKHLKTYKYLKLALKDVVNRDPEQYSGPKGFKGQAFTLWNTIRGTFYNHKKLGSPAELTTFADKMHDAIRKLNSQNHKTDE